MKSRRITIRHRRRPRAVREHPSRGRRPREPLRLDRQGGHRDRAATAGSAWASPGGWPRPGPRSPSSAATPRSRGGRGGSPRRRASRPLVVTADVAEPEPTSTAPSPRSLDRFGRIDILFNNAGINIRKPPQDLTLEEWHEVLDVNLTSAFLMSKAVYPAMKRAGGGKIINIGSMTSIFGVELRAGLRRRARAGSSSSPRAWPWPGPPTTSRSTRSCPAGSTPS